MVNLILQGATSGLIDNVDPTINVTLICLDNSLFKVNNENNLRLTQRTIASTNHI